MALGKRAWRWRKRAWRGAIVKVARGNTRHKVMMKPTNVIMFRPRVMMQPPHVIFINLTYGILVISDSYGVPYS